MSTPASPDIPRAILYGLALGDALGWPVEFLSGRDIRKKYGQPGIQEPPSPALFTDDTQMTLAIARALAECGEASPDAIMAAVTREFVAWLRHPDTPQRSPGVATVRAVDALARGVAWREAGLPDAKGCGSAMRVAAIGYLYQNDPAKLRAVAHATGIATHRQADAQAASIGAAYLVKLALDGVSPADYPRLALEFTRNISKDYDGALVRVTSALHWADEAKALQHVGPTRGGGWLAEEAVAMALFCVLKSPDDYVTAVRRAANIEGDSDSVACIAGGILGARLGLDALPADWIARLERREEIDELAVRLARKKAMLG